MDDDDMCIPGGSWLVGVLLSLGLTWLSYSDMKVKSSPSLGSLLLMEPEELTDHHVSWSLCPTACNQRRGFTQS
jgi:hypothetical protein